MFQASILKTTTKPTKEKKIMNKELKKILAIIGLLTFLFLASIAYIITKNSPNEQNVLASEVDTKFTYSDMQAANESRKNEYTDAVTSYSISDQTNSKPQKENNIIYGAEETRVRQVSQNLELYKPVDEANDKITSSSHLAFSKSKNNIPVFNNSSNLHGEEPVSKPIMEQKSPKIGNLFNDSSFEAVTSENNHNHYISAVIHGEQSIREGSQIKLRTTQDFTQDGESIPKNTFIFGQAMISENRLNISVSGFRANGTIFRVEMIALDQDGTSGLRLINGQGEGVTDQAIDVADYSTNNALDNIPVINSIAQGTREILRNRRTTNAKPITLSSNYKLFLKKI